MSRFLLLQEHAPTLSGQSNSSTGCYVHEKYYKYKKIMKNIEFKDKNTVRIHEKAKLITKNNKKIIFVKNCIIAENALIIADKEDCIITDSYISAEVRIRNSKIESVKAYPGSQILETNIKISSEVDKNDYLIVLNQGTNYKEENFAFTRGAVIKRIDKLYVSNKIEIPTGHCLINSDELKKLKEKNDRKVKVFKILENEYYILNSQYSHAEDFEQFYDPVNYNNCDYKEKYNPENNQTDENVLVDISNIDKVKAQTNSNELEKIKEIYKKSKNKDKLMFLDRENGITIIDK